MTKPIYRPYLIAVRGVKAQLEADMNALDQIGDDLIEEVDVLGKELADAYKLCEKIIAKAEAEPEPTE